MSPNAQQSSTNRPDETYGLFICSTKYGERTHLTKDYDQTLCQRAAIKRKALSGALAWEEIEIPAASHWIQTDVHLCRSCLEVRNRIVAAQTAGETVVGLRGQLVWKVNGADVNSIVIGVATDSIGAKATFSRSEVRRICNSLTRWLSNH